MTLEQMIITLVATILFAIISPILGCLLSGLDRIISARMQGRVGPPLLQPYYDIRKLLLKEKKSVNGIDSRYLSAALLFTAFAGGVFFSGGNLLMSIFLLAMANLLIIVAAYSTRSPYAEVGAHREILQVLSYEPMIILMAVAFSMKTHSFDVESVFYLDKPLIIFMIPIFIGFCYVLTIKLRKSPFDLASSHHAHQELVKGTTTEMSGSNLAKVEIIHMSETILFLGWVGMFFVNNSMISLVIAIIVALLIWFFEIIIDNNFARVKWQVMVASSWIVTAICTIATFVILIFV